MYSEQSFDEFKKRITDAAALSPNQTNHVQEEAAALLVLNAQYAVTYGEIQRQLKLNPVPSLAPAHARDMQAQLFELSQLIMVFEFSAAQQQ
jgi:hypothetical protein